MLKVRLINFKLNTEETFDCLQAETEGKYYKFYMSEFQLKYVPSYDFILDITYPYELKFNTDA